MIGNLTWYHQTTSSVPRRSSSNLLSTMATLDETHSEFPVHSSETAAIDNGDESYADENTDEYNSEFEDSEPTSPQPRAATPPAAVTAADTTLTSTDAQVNKPPALDMQQEQPAANASIASPVASGLIKPSLLPSRLPVRVVATKIPASSAFAPVSVSAPVSRLSSKPLPVAARLEAATVSQPTSPRTETRTTPSVPSTSAAPKLKAVSSSAPTSKPPSRRTSKSRSSTSTTFPSISSASSSSSSASSPTAVQSSTRPAAFIKASKPASHKTSKPSFDFSASTAHRSSTAASTASSTESSTVVPIDSKVSPQLVTLQREARWDPTPFMPPIVPLFHTTQHKTTTHPLLDIKHSAWQLQQPRSLPTPPNVLLRKPRSEVVTRMSDVVMRTRQLRRRTKDRAGADGGRVERRVEEKGEVAEEGVNEVYGEDGDVGSSEVAALRLAVGERVERQSGSRPRHNSPLARSRVTASSR